MRVSCIWSVSKLRCVTELAVSKNNHVERKIWNFSLPEKNHYQYGIPFSLFHKKGKQPCLPRGKILSNSFRKLIVTETF